MSAAQEFVISRTFNAPRAKVWKAFTQVEHLDRWWGPKGFAMKTSTLDFRPGGIFHYKMQAPGGPEIWGKFYYKEIKEPEMIVFTNTFSDAEGGVTRNPWMPTWPLEVQNTMIFEEKDGQTTITLRGGPINANEEEMKTFEQGKAGMQQGFKGTWDQLEQHLATM